MTSLPYRKPSRYPLLTPVPVGCVSSIAMCYLPRTEPDTVCRVGCAGRTFECRMSFREAM